MAHQVQQKILIYGGGILGVQIYHLLKEHFIEEYSVVGFIDDMRPKNTRIVDDISTVGGLEHCLNSDNHSPEKVTLVMAIGYDLLDKKHLAYEHAAGIGYKFETLVHPNAYIEKTVVMGEGNIFLAGTVIDQRVAIGNVNYFDISTTVGECSQIGNTNYVAAGSTLAGYVKLGDSNFVGLDTTVLSYVEIGSRNFINAKTFLASNIKNDHQIIQVHQVRAMKRTLEE